MPELQELKDRTVHCPYCDESIDVLIDNSVPEQDYIEDCQVCCRPINVRVTIAFDGNLSLSVSGEND